MTITGLGRRIKHFLGRIPKDALIVLTILLTATGSFGLGILAGKDIAKGENKGIWIEQRPTTEADLSMVPAVQSAAIPEGGQYVASKNGSAYYLPWCGGVSRIKEENKVWFASKEEAEAKGYTPAKNCKGI